jgi:hypothetical protein
LVQAALQSLGALAIGAAALLGGCASSSPQAPNTGLLALGQEGSGTKVPEKLPKEAPPAPGDITAIASRAALDLQQVIDSGALNRKPKAAVKAAAEEPAPVEAPTQADMGPPGPPPLGAAAVEAPVTPEDHPLELARRMAALLREKKIPDAVALAPIEAMQPGVLAELESPKNALGSKLSPEDVRTLADARDRILAQPGAANESLARTLARLAPPPALKIGRAVLCTRVQGFGRYDPLYTDTFVAGKPIRAIVYIELDGFMSRPARAGDPVDSAMSLSDQVSVEMSQAITLFHDPSGLQAKFIPPKTVVDTTRNKRRDFYLIQQIELPATLTIGKYNLKITVKDMSSGGEAEAVLPVKVVADSSAIARVK